MRRGSDWTPVYMIIVIVIAAILFISLVKPLFANAQSSSQTNLDQAKGFAKGALFALGAVLRK
ncbi:hypothetical protein HY993_04880 [Candidatus Micrarchaeota archaeon]|nr:hypothetical protein [Candidatus Micrarchaeota archaeon]